MLLRAESRLSRSGAVPAMVRRSDGWSRGDRGFSTHLLGVLSMAAGGVEEPVGGGDSD